MKEEGPLLRSQPSSQGEGLVKRFMTAFNKPFTKVTFQTCNFTLTSPSEIKWIILLTCPFKTCINSCFVPNFAEMQFFKLLANFRGRG